MKAGDLKYRITIQRITSTTDPLGGETKEWADLASCYAAITFGTGKERRQAAQETASAPATFHIRRNSTTATLTPADRVSFDGSDWDIISAVPSREFRADIDITAVRRTA